MTRIVVVGIGALGSHVVQLLRNVDATLRLIDFDRVEQRNTASQFHAKGSVGKLKVQGLQQSMKFLFGRKVDVVSHKLVDDNAEQLLGDADLIVDCVDNAGARALIQGFARTRSIPCVHGALAADGSFGRVIWSEDFQIDGEPAEGAPTCEDGEQLPFIAITAAYLAYAVQAFFSRNEKHGYQIHAGGAHAV